jgi:lipoate-protein ligase B
MAESLFSQKDRSNLGILMSSLDKKVCLVCSPGLITFPEAMEYERRLIDLRFQGKIGDVLLILEHPPTITLGRFGNLSNVLLPPEELSRRGIAFFNSDRGGDATFNCPGQTVIHPVMDLHFKGARTYISQLEETGLRVLSSYGIVADTPPQHHGIWVKGRQMAALGLRMRHSISMHGMSLNVNPYLNSFEMINLCGIAGASATSIERELGRSVTLEEVNRRILESFSSVFDVELQPVSKEWLKKECFEPQNSQVV